MLEADFQVDPNAPEGSRTNPIVVQPNTAPSLGVSDIPGGVPIEPQPQQFAQLPARDILAIDPEKWTPAPGPSPTAGPGGVPGIPAVTPETPPAPVAGPSQPPAEVPTTPETPAVPTQKSEPSSAAEILAIDPEKWSPPVDRKTGQPDPDSWMQRFSASQYNYIANGLALPIGAVDDLVRSLSFGYLELLKNRKNKAGLGVTFEEGAAPVRALLDKLNIPRSEERRVGKECRL